MMPVWEEQRGRSSWETTWDCDPLIQTLCGKSSLDSEARKLYEELRLCEPTNSYDLHDQFPFFGKRLVELQQFMKQHQPQTVRSLLSDRRDVAAWYTLWNNQVRFIARVLYCYAYREIGRDCVYYHHHIPYVSFPVFPSMASYTCKRTNSPRS